MSLEVLRLGDNLSVEHRIANGGVSEAHMTRVMLMPRYSQDYDKLLPYLDQLIGRYPKDTAQLLLTRANVLLLKASTQFKYVPPKGDD